MFFIFGISQGEKKLDYIQTMLCSSCGQFGRLELYMTYTYFSLFFIPIFRWSKKYYIKSTCCNTLYEIDCELGKRLHRGEGSVREEDLRTVYGKEASDKKRCPVCGYYSVPEYSYCPRCGNRL